MGNVLVLGGGFGGVVAAERPAKTLGPEHQITLVTRSSRFMFYPALVRLAFGYCEPDDVSFDLNSAMLDRRIRFVEAEVARVDPFERRVILAHGEVEGEMPYDYLVFALGRRLTTELVPGFYEHARHLLTVEAALKFGEAVRDFHEGYAVIGYCQGACLAVPVYETAFALSRYLEELTERERVRITLVSPEPPSSHLGGMKMANALRDALDADNIEFLPDFALNRVSAKHVSTEGGHRIHYDLLMLIPPFGGASAVREQGITDGEGFIRVDRQMRVPGVERMYAVGDAANFPGPKMGHMAVRQAEVTAENVAAEIKGQRPSAFYENEMKLVIDEGGKDSIYLHKGLRTDDGATVRQGRFWHWAKLAHEKYWESQHS